MSLTIQSSFGQLRIVSLQGHTYLEDGLLDSLHPHVLFGQKLRQATTRGTAHLHPAQCVAHIHYHAQCTEGRKWTNTFRAVRSASIKSTPIDVDYKLCVTVCARYSVCHLFTHDSRKEPQLMPGLIEVAVGSLALQSRQVDTFLS